MTRTEESLGFVHNLDITNLIDKQMSAARSGEFIWKYSQVFLPLKKTYTHGYYITINARISFFETRGV